MNKRLSRTVAKILIAATSIMCLPKEVQCSEEIQVEAKSAILMETSSGKIVYEKNAHEKFAPASVTKIMTMLIAMEAVDSGKMSLSDKITASENAKKIARLLQHFIFRDDARFLLLLRGA